MKHPERIKEYLEHISEAIDRAIGYLQDNADFASFQEDHRNQDAVVRNIEIIGEAASRIQKSGPEFTVQHPEVPWTQMRAMRNLVIHEYFSLDLKIIWSTIKNDLPSLKRQIDILLQGLQRDSGTL